MQTTADGLKILTLRGKDIHPYISNLAELRIKIFRDYPFLYEGEMKYEAQYLNTYIECAECMMVLVLDDDNVVGVSTAIPLEFETMDFKKPFLDLNMDISKIFYFGESLLEPPYRGRGLYNYFFRERERAAKAYNATTAAFCTIVRSKEDPRKPLNFMPLDAVWLHFGYQKRPDLQTHCEYKEIGEAYQSPKLFEFWSKDL